MHKVLKIKAEKDQFKAKKRKMESIIFDLLKHKEYTMGNMRKIRELIEE
jgi:hypothetical protein